MWFLVVFFFFFAFKHNDNVYRLVGGGRGGRGGRRCGCYGC